MSRLLREREHRGLTYRELSECSGVPAHTLSWWSWKLRREAEDSPAFVEVEVADMETSSAFEVEAPSGHVLRIPSDFDSTALRRLLQVLSSC
jgi:hypothetical protein